MKRIQLLYKTKLNLSIEKIYFEVNSKYLKKYYEIIIQKYWKEFLYRLNNTEQSLLDKKIIFKYNSETTFFDLFKYLNLIYLDIISNFEESDIKK